MEFNKAYLNYLITKNGYTTESFIKKFGFSYASWYRRMNNPDLFTYDDIKKIASALKLTINELEEIFFK